MLRSLIARIFPHLDRLSLQLADARKREGVDNPAPGPAPRGYHRGLWPVLRSGWKEPSVGVGGRYLPREKEFYAEPAQ